MGRLVEFQNVKKTYHMGEVEIHAVDGVDFEINEGEFVVIVGPSGAGKTTVLNILYDVSCLLLNELISTPSTITCPLVALSIPPRIFNTVVFPAPLGPTMTTNSPSFISKSDCT